MLPILSLVFSLFLVVNNSYYIAASSFRVESSPNVEPTKSPSRKPTVSPISKKPSISPSAVPTKKPTIYPSLKPTKNPSTSTSGLQKPTFSQLHFHKPKDDHLLYEEQFFFEEILLSLGKYR